MKAKYKFIQYGVKVSSCKDCTSFGTYSIAVVPMLQNEKSGKTIFGKTVYRITGVTKENHKRMLNMAYYIAKQASKMVDPENIYKPLFRSWRKDYEVMHSGEK